VHLGHNPTSAHCSPGHSGGSGGYPARPRSQRWCGFCRLTCLATGNIDEVLIQEPWIVGNNICGLSSPLYKLFYTKDKGKTRTFILTKTHFNTFLVPQFSEGDLTAVRLELNENTHHTIASFYLAHDYEGPLPNITTQQLIHTN